MPMRSTAHETAQRDGLAAFTMSVVLGAFDVLDVFLGVRTDGEGAVANKDSFSSALPLVLTVSISDDSRNNLLTP